MYSYLSNPVLKQCFAALISLNLHLSMGICHGFSAVLLPQLQSKKSILQINDDDASWIASTSMITMPIAALMVGVLMDRYGRKKIVQISFIPLFLGWAVISQASSVIVLCLGRVITGIAVGMDPAVIIYIAEINSPKYRGILLSLTGPSVLVGMLISYLLGHFLYWQNAAMILSMFSFLCWILLFFIPESPAWLILKGRHQEAYDSLLWFHMKSEVVDMELQAAQNARIMQDENKIDNEPILRQIMSSKAWKPLGILTIFFCLQQFTGNSIIFYYAVNFYESFGTQMDSFMTSITHLVLSLVSSLAFTAVIERYNRKTMTITSAAGICITCTLAGIYEYVYENVAEKPVSWFPIVCMWTNVTFSTLGLTPLPWLMTGELFPSNVRGFLSGILWTISYFFMFITVKLYLVTIAYLKIYGVLGIFSIAAFTAVIFGKFILPDTRGKTLTEIENSF